MDADGCRWVRKGTTVQADKQTRQACTYIGTQHMLFGLMAGKFPQKFIFMWYRHKVVRVGAWGQLDMRMGALGL